MPLVEHEIACIAELIDHLGKLGTNGKTVWFRGHSCGDWKLAPSLSRNNKLGAEIKVTKRFKQNAYQFLSHVPEKEWEWMFLMQHYGVPTRLLDWTENPLIGLYFASREEAFSPGQKRPEAALWCLFPQKLNEMSGIALQSPDDILAFGEEDELNDYLPSRVSQGISNKNPLAIIAPRQFGRVVAQQGVFTIMHKEPRNIEDLHDSDNRQPHLVKIKIKRRNVHRIRKELDILRINKLFVFPQLENVAAEATGTL